MKECECVKIELGPFSTRTGDRFFLVPALHIMVYKYEGTNRQNISGRSE